MVYDESLKQDQLIDFMQRLIRDNTKKVSLILDNLRVHHGKRVDEWVTKNSERIKLFFLPPYSPEINPDEYLNQTLVAA